MNVFITGHTGFLGKHVVDEFRRNGHMVYGIARSTSDSAACHQYALDVRDFDNVKRLFREKCADAVVHCAAKAIVSDCAADPFGGISTNVIGAASILESARAAGKCRVVVVETDKVYGVQKDMPTDESAIPNPDSPYEISKAIAATLCGFYRAHYGMPVVSARPVNLFGPGDPAYTRIVPAAMRAILDGKGIPVHHHAVNMVRDFLYVKDAARMIYKLATSETRDAIYNLSAGFFKSILEVANTITATLNHGVRPTLIDKPGEYSEIPAQVIDGSRFVREFGFEFTKFEDAIIETYKSYQ